MDGARFSGGKNRPVKSKGVPFALRVDTVYDKIGGLFGRVVRSSEFSWENTDNSGGDSVIITEVNRKIDEQVRVTWRGKDYSVWVREVEEAWLPEFEESERYSDMEDMEEGEYRQE